MKPIATLRYEARQCGLDVSKMSTKALRAWDRARRKGLSPAMRQHFAQLAATRGVSVEQAAGLVPSGEFVQGWRRKAYWWVRWKLALLRDQIVWWYRRAHGKASTSGESRAVLDSQRGRGNDGHDASHGVPGTRRGHRSAGT